MTTLHAPTDTREPRLRHGADRRDRWLAVLMQVSRAIGSVRDSRALMQAIMEQVTHAFDADRSSLYLYDHDRSELWTRVAQGLEDRPREIRVPSDHGLCGRVFATHQPLRIADTFNEPDFDRRLAERTGYVPHSMLIAPVLQKDRCVGVLQVMDRRIGHFTDEDLAFLEAVAVQVAISLENAALYQAQRRQFRSFVESLSAALDARDPLTAIHSVNVANYAMGIGTILGLKDSDLERLRIAGLVHDVGKIGVPEAVLTKAGRLTREEFDEMKRHAAQSRQILSKIEFSDELNGLDFIAAAHHEKLDGSGYPDGLKGDEIPLLARILCVADIYDALTQTRHYRQGMTMHEALKQLDEMAPHQVDRNCVAALKAFLGCGPWPAPE
ncbi:MAG: hypothetical protein DCC63_14690 [Nitrospira sp.]|nr:MAG: hypothetical protein DCC63_14690 [Nitrospira sp.]